MNVVALLVWAAVLWSSLTLVRGVRRERPAPAAAPPRLYDLYEAAFLSGGPGRVVDTALVSLLGDGRLELGGPGIVRMHPDARAADPAEQAVLHACLAASSGALHIVRYEAMCHPAVQEIGDALAGRGLLAPPGWGRRWRRRAVRQAVLCALAIPVSVVATVVQVVTAERPGLPFVVLALPALIGGLVVGAVHAARARARVTVPGLRALAEVRAFHRGDPAARVVTALSGPRALPDSGLRAQMAAAARHTPAVAAAHRRPGDSASDGASGDASGAAFVPVVWCAASDGGGWGGADGGGSGGDGSGGGSGCGSSSSSCSSGSSCGSSSSSSCGSSS
ncbi:TIGR04222 domain-containing membrane protein [Streptomyces sp. NPDC090022]|uniref:TIGR04222 domain-containing membrane protein n=1 Tax=Streptomyces sp. NPDC090022 TaxID=3365920 RepID=UPI0038308D75